MNNPHWNIVEKQDHFLSAKDPDGWYSASVKWDGCIDFTRYFNEPNGEMKDSIHICDIDDMIARLQALKQLCIENSFGEMTCNNG